MPMAFNLQDDFAPELGCPERIECLKEQSRVTGLLELPAATCACLWLADLSNIRHLIREATSDEDGLRSIIKLLDSDDAKNMLLAWGDRRTRDDKLAEELERHGHYGSIDIVCIFPETFDNLEKQAEASFWNTLCAYWNQDHVDSWEAETLEGKVFDTCANFVTFCEKVITLWKGARIAIKPLGMAANESKMTVQFFWLPLMGDSSRRSFTNIPHFDKNNLRLSQNDQSPPTQLFNLKTGQNIKSGDVMTFTTHDPIRLPLPSIKLLRMEWMLHRALALSGVVDAAN